MVLQCAVGSIVIFLPSQMKRRFGIRIPDTMEILYFIFLFCAIYLGEVRNFIIKFLLGFDSAQLQRNDARRIRVYPR